MLVSVTQLVNVQNTKYAAAAAAVNVGNHFNV